MTLQTTGPISLADIRGEFGGAAPDSVSEYVDKVGKTASAGQLVAFSEYYGLSAGPSGILFHTLDNPNAYGTSENDSFGQVVAISDSYCVVGAPGEDEAGGDNSGKAYIFDVSTGNLLHTLNNPDGDGSPAYDQFGLIIAITDSYCVIGVPYEDADQSGSNYDSGKVYVFNPLTGNLLYTLDDPNPYGTLASDNFGSSLAITDSYCIVGAAYEDDTSGVSSGKAYIFDVSTGNLLHTLDDPNPYGTTEYDYFGYSVAITDSYCIVGAYGEDDAGGTTSGKAYIFDTSTGNLIHTLDNPNPYGTTAYDNFGSSLAISGNHCIVGARSEDDASGTDSGKAYIFDVSTGNLIHTLNDPNAYGTSDGDYFGSSLAISGNYCIVGAANEDDTGGASSGKAYIFDVSTGNLLHTLDNPNAYGTSANDYFGFFHSVSISGNHCIVGAWAEDDANGTASGKAYIFK